MQTQRSVHLTRLFLLSLCLIVIVVVASFIGGAALVADPVRADHSPQPTATKVTGYPVSSSSPTTHPVLGRTLQSRLPTTPQHFVLPGTQPGGIIAAIPDPAGCNLCHTAAIYDAWRGSMMANAGRDPLFWAALTVANEDAAFSGEFCIRCHMLGGWLEGRSQSPDGSGLNDLDKQAGVACEVCHRMVDPVPAISATDQAKAIDTTIRAALTSTVPVDQIGSAMIILDPNDNRRGPFKITGAPHATFQTDFLGQSTNTGAESRLCGSCHDIGNPALVWTESPPNGAPPQFWPKSVTTTAEVETTKTDLPPTVARAEQQVEAGDPYPIESTYSEWSLSTYANGGVVAPEFAGAKADGRVASCQDCHLTRSTGKAADVGNAVTRDCQTTGCLPIHTLVGGNTWVPAILQDTRWRLHAADESSALNATIVEARQMLRKAATLTATIVLSGTEKLAQVRVTNQSGHKLPTGYAEGRRMWLTLRAYNDKGEIVFVSGAYNSSTGVLTQDSAIKLYEVEQGLTPELAQLVGLTAGPSFHFVLNNTVYKDNRIPPRGYTVASFDQPGLRPIGAIYADGQYWDETTYSLPSTAESIQVMLYYQTASKEYIDFLRTAGGDDGVALGTLWDASKSPPELMATAFYPIKVLYLPIIQK